MGEYERLRQDIHELLPPVIGEAPCWDGAYPGIYVGRGHCLTGSKILGKGLRERRHDVHLVGTEADRRASIDHFFLLETSGEPRIIDHSYKQFFTIASPTRRYVRFLAGLPDAFLGTRREFQDTIEELTAEGRRSFAHQGLEFPPEREPRHLDFWDYDIGCTIDWMLK